MSATRQTARRPQPAPQTIQLSGNLALMGLRVVLMGCVFALVGVLGHVALKVINT